MRADPIGNNAHVDKAMAVDDSAEGNDGDFDPIKPLPPLATAEVPFTFFLLDDEDIRHLWLWQRVVVGNLLLTQRQGHPASMVVAESTIRSNWGSKYDTAQLHRLVQALALVPIR